MENLRWIPPSSLGGGKRGFATGVSAFRLNPVASHLACDVSPDATKRYIKLQQEDRLRLGLQVLPFNGPQLAAGSFAPTTTPREAIEAYQFDRTAECVFADEIPDYASFRKALAFMASLRCEASCRERAEGTTSCVARACCIEKGHFARHECAAFETGDTFRENVERGGYISLESIHAIRKMGLDAWLTSWK